MDWPIAVVLVTLIVCATISFGEFLHFLKHDEEKERRQ